MSAQHIILVGPMGAGKSTVGRNLAQLLRRPFVDIDNAIEERCGANIPWIFDVEGEEGFRTRETAMLSEVLSSSEPTVVATGGGVVMREENRRLLVTGGTVVYLSATLAQLAKRTAKDTSRPLLQVDDPVAVLEQLLQKRDPLYRQVADIVVSSAEGPPGRLARSLVDTLQDYSPA